MTQDITSILQEKFLERPRTFWHHVDALRFDQLRRQAQRVMWKNLVWDWGELCISHLARHAAELLDFAPSEVFAHTLALVDEPQLEQYYCLLACVSETTLTEIISIENQRRHPLLTAKFLNLLISSRVEEIASIGGCRLLNEKLSV